MNIVELEKSYRRLHYRWARLANHAHAVRQQLREVDEKIREIKGVYQSTLDARRQRETERTLAGALHKQGFTITQIADQLRLSRGQAASRLRQWKRRATRRVDKAARPVLPVSGKRTASADRPAPRVPGGSLLSR